MSRTSLLSILSDREQSLFDVWQWSEFQRALIGEEKGRVFDAFDAGTDLAIPRYVGKTRDELDDYFVYQVAELESVTILGMFACGEAALRVDFIERVRNKKKDVVSREFRAIYKKRGEKIRLEEDILDTWKIHGPDAKTTRAVAEFKGALNLRHWLAHGRYWKPKLGRAAGYDAIDVFDISKRLLQTISLMAPDAATP